MYFVYIIKNPKGNYYIGYTKNIAERIKRHNKNRSNFTKNKGSWTLIYKESFLNKSDAIKRENYIKSQKSKKFIESLFNSQRGGGVVPRGSHKPKTLVQFQSPQQASNAGVAQG